MNFQISGRLIGAGHPTYIIAEISANHNGNYENALRIVKAAADAGADAVKLQTYTADTITIDSTEEPFRVGKGSLWEGRTLHELYHEAHTPWDWQPGLKAEAERLGMHCFSSPFDATAIEFLEAMDVPAYKVASFEIVDLPLIRAIAETGKPMIMSTGMATLGEIDEAVAAARSAGAKQIALLKCTSAYPAAADEMNLRTIPHLQESFNVPVGLSDHTLGTQAPIVAVSMGASIVEKHLTLSRSDGGPDSAFSLEPAEFAAMVRDIRETEASLGQIHYGANGKESTSMGFRRSLFVVEDMDPGDLFTPQNVRSIRPSGGLHTRHFDDVMGRAATAAIARGSPLDWSHIGGSQSAPKENNC